MLVLPMVAACPPTGGIEPPPAAIDDDDSTDAPDDDDDSGPLGYVDQGEVSCASPTSEFARFEEQTEARGIIVDDGAPEPGMTSTVAAIDGDGDGDVDLFFSSARNVPQTFENDGEGNFTRVVQAVEVPAAAGAGIAPTGVFLLADFTGDGLPDLITLGPGLILFSPNLGDLRWGPFHGIDWYPDNFANTFTANVGDVDGDGDLDLFVPGLDQVVDQESSWPTSSYGRLYLNDGVTLRLERELGLAGGLPGLSVVGVFTDRDGDGDQDLFSVSDHGNFGWPASAFYRNDGPDEEGAPILVDDGAETGTNLAVSGMGIDVVDLNGDGVFDYCISDIGRPKCLLSIGEGWYEAGLSMGLDTPPLGADQHWSGWSVDVADFDLDGHLDLAMPAAFPAQTPDPTLEGDFSYQPDALWQGDGDGGFVLRSDETGFNSEHKHYGGTVADLDGDGHLELITSGGGTDAHVTWNRCGEGAWLLVDLVAPSPNANALGARVQVIADGVLQGREVQNLRTYGQGPGQVHFGLGSATEADVRIRWPDGQTSDLRGVGTRRRITVTHPDFEGFAETTFGTGPDLFDVDVSPDFGTLSGEIMRDVALTGDGLGVAHVQLFPGNPFDFGAEPIAETSMSADFGDDDAAVAYSLDEIPPRDTAYFLLAWFDEDDNGALDDGDLYDSDGYPLTVPMVVVSDAGTVVTFPVVLDEDVGIQ